MMFEKDEENMLAEAQLQHMHKIIMDLFLQSCSILVKEDLKDHEYQYCIETIHNTLYYIGAQRKEKKYQSLRNLRAAKE